jgi:hypothetical protein
MNTISTNSTINFVTSDYAGNDGGCTHPQQGPIKASPFFAQDGVESYDGDDGGCTPQEPTDWSPFHKGDKLDTVSAEAGGTITCPAGTQPTISTTDNGQTVVVVCEDAKKGGPKPKAIKAPILD